VREATTLDVRESLARLRAAGSALVARPADDIAGVLGDVGMRFLDPDDSLRTEALEQLPLDGGLSPQMAAEVLDGMARDWSADRLRRTLRAEFGDPRCLDVPTEVDGRRLMAFGPRVCVQIASGSVPGVSVNALLRSLLVKAPTLIKPGRGDALLTELFARGLAERDPGLASALSVLYWSGGSEEVEREAMTGADVAVVYGSDATVHALRAMAPPTTRIVGYHHRMGVALVGRESDPVGAAADLARAVALFEQRGCVCPHRVWVEEGGAEEPVDFASRLAEAMADLESVLPSAPLSPEEASAVQQLRGTSELQAGVSGGRVWHGGSMAPWTVVYEPGAMPGPGTLARGVRVHPLTELSGAAEVLAPLGAHLQTVGYAGFDARTDRLMEIAGRAGASRVVPLREMAFPPPWWLHDGRGPLRDLVRWIEVEAER
jgi:acyl-CoA reductase-like NAD-dependent aldehyde dehydrogenase